MTTNAGWWDRLGAAAGIGFVAISIAASSFLTEFDDGLGPERSTESMLAKVNPDHAIGESLSVVALFCFFCFLGSYRATLARAEGDDGWLAWVAFGAGAAAGGLLMVATQTHMTLSAFETPDEGLRAPYVYLWMGSSALGAATASMAGATAAISFRHGTLPRGLGAFGALIALLCLTPINQAGGLMHILFMFWVLVMSIYMVTRASRRVAVAETATTVAVGPAP
jgi:hypothetical protein